MRGALRRRALSPVGEQMFAGNNDPWALSFLVVVVDDVVDVVVAERASSVASD